MVRIKEIKISIHRKYTKDFQSYGYRVGLMLDVDKVDNARTCYYHGKAFLNERIAEEDLIIKNIMVKRVAEKGSGYKELNFVPEGNVVVKNIVDKGVAKKKSDSDGDGDKLIPFDVRSIKSTSAKAVLVELFGNKGDLWIPKSCVRDGDAVDKLMKGEKTMLYVKNWFLEKSGLI